MKKRHIHIILTGTLDDSNFIVQGWNKIETPDNYIYTVNLWFEDEIQHSHNFRVYKLLK